MYVYSIVRIPPGNFLNNRIQNSENIRTANQRYGPGSDASALIPPDGKTKYRPDFLYCPAQDSTLNVTCDVLTNLTRNLYVFLPHQIHPHAVQQCNPRQSEKSRCQCAQRIDSDARIQPFFLQISVYQKNCDHSKNQPQHKIQRKLRSLFISPPAQTSLVYIYSCLSHRYSYHTMETTADISSPCPDIHCPDVYFFQFFSIL